MNNAVRGVRYKVLSQIANASPLVLIHAVVPTRYFRLDPEEFRKAPKSRASTGAVYLMNKKGMQPVRLRKNWPICIAVRHFLRLCGTVTSNAVKV
jgi:hypothetical protein